MTTSSVKTIARLSVVGAERLGSRHTLLRLRGELPRMEPGQFVQALAEGSPGSLLRRPISVCMAEGDELWLLVAAAGAATRWLASRCAGDSLNCVLPLGRGFSVPSAGERTLLVGGGVGVAPLLFLARRMAEGGAEPTIVLGARSGDEVLLEGEFGRYGRVFIATDDGSAGERGFAAQHSILSSETFDRVACCGPKPMMMAVAREARRMGAECEVSLENMMACGLGACLCCVEHTARGNVCVCKEGPVFNINDLLWQT